METSLVMHPPPETCPEPALTLPYKLLQPEIGSCDNAAGGTAIVRRSGADGASDYAAALTIREGVSNATPIRFSVFQTR